MNTPKKFNQIKGLLGKLVSPLFGTRVLNFNGIDTGYEIEWVGWRQYDYMHHPFAGIRYPFTGGGF